MPTLNPHPFAHVLTTLFKLRVVTRLLDHSARGRLLDVGCGCGFVLSQVEDLFASAIGVDVSREALDFGRTYSRSGLAVADAERIPFPDATFDHIISTDAFEHIPDDQAAILEIERALKPGGCFIVYVPCESGILSRTRCAGLFHSSEASPMLDHRSFTVESLVVLVEEAGLEVEYVGYHNVFAQELCTQVLKWVGSRLGKAYENQADIMNFTGSTFYPLYRQVALPAIRLWVRIEEVICEKFLRARIPGHRIVMKCRKAAAVSL